MGTAPQRPSSQSAGPSWRPTRRIVSLVLALYSPIKAYAPTCWRPCPGLPGSCGQTVQPRSLTLGRPPWSLAGHRLLFVSLSSPWLRGRPHSEQPTHERDLSIRQRTGQRLDLCDDLRAVKLVELAPALAGLDPREVPSPVVEGVLAALDALGGAVDDGADRGSVVLPGRFVLLQCA